MADILLNIHIQAPPEKVRAALDSVEGLANWWTQTTTGDASVGGHIDFRFGSHVTQVRVDRVDGAHVHWTVISSNPTWEGTRLTFDLEAKEGQTLLRFGHRDWPEAGDFYGHCSMKWATFLLSLRAQVEEGAGKPFPDDVSI